MSKITNTSFAGGHSLQTTIFHDPEPCPHWIRHGQVNPEFCWNSMEVNVSTAGWVSFDVREGYFTEPNRRKAVEKRTMTTLREHQARQLYAMLHEQFGKGLTSE